MNDVEVTAVSLDQDNRIRAFIRGSRSADYEHINRDASGVRCDPEARYLYSEVPRKLSHADWYGIIRSAIRNEYGEKLVLTERTIWDGVPLDMKVAIQRAEDGSAA